MKVLGIRFCKVAKKDDAEGLAALLGEKGLGLSATDFGESDAFQGAVFPVDDAGAKGPESNGGSWIEIWPAGDTMPEMTMLQIVVDDADAYAEQARRNGVDVKGPDDAHGERIYYLEGPGGLPIAFQSKVTTYEDRSAN